MAIGFLSVNEEVIKEPTPTACSYWFWEESLVVFRSSEEDGENRVGTWRASTGRGIPSRQTRSSGSSFPSAAIRRKSSAEKGPCRFSLR